MFGHSLKYNLLVTIRDKSLIFWSLIFCMILGTLFHVTFKDAYDSMEHINNVKVVAYIEDEMVSENFKGIIAGISLDEVGGEKLLDVTYCESMEEAEKFLDEEDTVGMFYSENSALRLTVKNEGIVESILSTVVSEYHQIITIMTKLEDKEPEVLIAAMATLFSEKNNNVEKALSDGEMDVFAQYFYNLLAMSCLLASSMGITFAVRNQGNLSDLGARKNIANASSAKITFGGLTALWIVIFACAFLSMLYLMLIGVDFGNKIGQITLILAVGSLFGLSLGFFLGNIGNLSAGAKEGICVGVSMVMCFLSGLMIADMRMLIELKCPIINRINPAVLISDSFYALNIFDTYERYTENLVKLLIMSLVLLIGGLIMGRRKQYASL